VQEKYVNGWDDPRMPTLSEFGAWIPSRGNSQFLRRIGVSKQAARSIGHARALHSRGLNKRAPRVMAVLRR